MCYSADSVCLLQQGPPVCHPGGHWLAKGMHYLCLYEAGPWNFVSVDNIVKSLLLFSLGFLSVTLIFLEQAALIIQAKDKQGKDT